MNSTTKIIAGVAVLALLFAGIGFAATYSGTATNTGNNGDASYLTVSLGFGAEGDYKEFINGTYYLSTETAFGTDGLVYTYTDVKKGTETATESTVKFVKGTDGFAIAGAGDTATHKAFEIKSIVAAIDVSASTVKNVTFNLNDGNGADASEKYWKDAGISVVFTTTTDEEAVLTSEGLPLSGQEAAYSVTVKAYLVVPITLDEKPTATIHIEDTAFKFVASAEIPTN